MNIDQIEVFLKWMTLLNVGIMIFSAVMFGLFKRQIFKFHGRLFEIEEENLSILVYGYLGLYKVLIILFNLIPYIALQFVR